MESKSRFKVSVEELDAVRVDATEQVQEQAEPPPPEAASWIAPGMRPYVGGGGMTDGDD